MARGTSRRTALVADRRPLERGLARFLLEERGLFVVGEAATMADVLLQVQQLRPDVLVLHEKLALDHDPSVIAQIRRISARTSIVLLAASREALPPELLLLADTVVEDGPGLTELGAAVAGPASETVVTTTEAVAVGAGATVAAPLARGPGSRWGDRLQGLLVASIIALAFVIARGMTTPTLVPTVVGRAHMSAAWDSLGELQSALPSATPEQIAEIASTLIDDRAAAEAAGVSLTTFDQALLHALIDVWPNLSTETQELLAALFGPVIEGGDVPPPEPAPSPQPTPEPSPAPSEAPVPSETPAPAATETPAPAATETPAPPPTETTTPPTETTTPPTETTTPPTETTTTTTETTTTTTETTTSPPETTTSPAETTTSPAETTTSPAETTTSPTETTTSPTETTTPPTETTTPPTETTTPPTETTTPQTETTTPPTETTTPPAETTTPPAETTTTTPILDGGTATGSLVVIPFALTLLLALSGWARRRWRDPAGDRDESDPS